MDILVPTDFSDNATNALDYAIDIVNHLGGQILLYHTYDVRSTTGSFISMETVLRKDAERELEDCLHRVSKRLMPKKAGIRGQITRGDTVNLIADMADRHGFDLIVMGTQGASGLKEVFIGSVTAGVMKKSKTPILAIPSSFKYRPISNIVIAVDSSPISSPEILQPFIQLAKSYEAKIGVLHLRNSEVDEGIDPQLDQYLGSMPYSVFHYLQQGSLSDSISDFVIQKKADLLCMFRHERGFWQDLFHTSTTLKKIFNSPVPLLILRD
ncbi:MAG: universal stress protein [Bacteroidota bacterium]